MFVVAASFLLLDLDDKFHPVSTNQYSANIDYTETPKQIIIPDVEPKKQIAQKQAPIKVQLEPKSRLSELEEKEFSLNLSGDAYVLGMTKKANLVLKLEPIKGTDLQKFTISESRLIIDGSGAVISGVDASLDGVMLTLNFAANNVGQFSILAILDEQILDDTNYKQNASVENQNFYLVKKETPYQLNLVGTLKS